MTKGIIRRYGITWYNGGTQRKGCRNSKKFFEWPQMVYDYKFCSFIGLSALQYVDLNSPRNLYILGFSIFFPMVLCQWMAAHPGVINTGLAEADSILTVLLSTTILVGGITGCFLDNLIPGMCKILIFNIVKFCTFSPFLSNDQIVSTAKGKAEFAKQFADNSKNTKYQKKSHILFDFFQDHQKSEVL